MERIIKRGDIYYAELNPVIGSEQGGTRPVLIISNDIGNKHSPTVIIAAITSRVHTKAKLPTHTAVSNYEGLDKDSVILLEQIRTIDKQRLKQYMGMMPDNIMARVDKALAISVCQTAHCGRGKSHFIFGGLASPIVPYRNLTQTTDGITADCRSLV